MEYRALKNHRAFGRIGLAAGFWLWPSSSYAYQIHIANGGTQIIGAATSITSVLGEARPTSSSSGMPFTPNRFHQGVDIAEIFLSLGPRAQGSVFNLPEITMRRLFARALENANIQGFRFHDLRHTFASHFVMRTVATHVTPAQAGVQNLSKLRTITQMGV